MTTFPKEKTLLFSVTRDDLDMQTFSVSGAGGGGKDTSNSGVRLIHRVSGAVGEGRETRSLTQNRRAAFKRLVKTEKFKKWHKIETNKLLGKKIYTKTPDEVVDEIMDVLKKELDKDEPRTSITMGDYKIEIEMTV